MKKIIAIIAAIVLTGAGCAAPARLPANDKSKADHKNISYMIEGERALLVNGRAESESAPGSASKNVTLYFGNEVRADLDGDGSEDVAFLLTRNGGGSGTFFYLAAALGGENGYEGTNAVFLGDRIAPQTTEFRGGEIIVNYAERKTDPSAPSMGVSRYFKVSEGSLVESTK